MTTIKQIEKFVYEVEKEGAMKIPGRLYVNEHMLNILKEEEKTNWSTLRQLKNVATLPGLQKHVLALADCHPGYGSPIGGVFAADVETGVITFGGIGFDINCGVRTLTTNLEKEDIEKKKQELADVLFKEIPAGLGSTGELKLSASEIDEVLVNGAEYVVKRGYGTKEDLRFIEENGKIDGADPNAVSHKAKERQFKQVGTLGSGNHYLEVQYVEKIFDNDIAKAYGLHEGQVVVSLHCGSRALGHQIGTDYLAELDKSTKKYGIKIPDRELVCAPVKSPEGERYFSAIKAGINCAFANRQVLAHLTRNAFTKIFPGAKLKTLYEVGHNTAKMEEHEINGEKKLLLVQRKGSTRGFGPGRKEIPEEYRNAGQPVLVGGSMGTASYILAGTEKGMRETFGSTVHGAGRTMSRVKATDQWRGQQIVNELAKQGIVLKGHGMKGIAEEAPEAYKDVNEVVEVMHLTGISKKVAKLRPLICIKG